MKYYNALYQAIKNEYKARNSEALIAFSPSGFIYDNEDFDLLNQENIDKEKLLTKEDLSYQFNSLTSNIKSWEIDVSNNLYLKYKEIIQAAELHSGAEPSTDFLDQMHVLYNDNGSDTKAFKKYKTYVTKYNTAIDKLQNHITSEDISILEGLDLENWKNKLETLQNSIKIILSEWIGKGNKLLINNALDKIYQENVIRNTSVTLAALKQNIEFQERTGLNSKSDYIEMQFIPFNFTSDNSKWSHLKLDKTKLNQLSEEFKKENPINISSINLDDEYEKYISAVAFDYCIVNINRSWFRKEIISSEIIPNSTKESFYASKLIFMKNLSIDLIDTEEKENNIINQGIIKFGPLILKNQVFKNINTNKLSLQPIESKKIYKSNNYKVLSKRMEIVSKTDIQAKPQTGNQLNQIRSFDKVKPNLWARAEIKPNPNPNPNLNLNPNPKNIVALEKASNISSLKKINFLPVINFQIKDNTGNLILRISNKIVAEKNEDNCTISIIGVNNEFIKEVVSNTNGEVTVSLPIGEYHISITKSGFKKLEFKQTIAASGNIIVNKIIEPTNIIYESMYLIGVCLNDLK